MNNNWTTDLEWIEEFFEFLQGKLPDSITLPRGSKPKMSAKKAFSIIWYLQEHFPMFPCNLELCSICGNLYDSDREGLYWKSKGKHYCGGCEYLVPDNYDNCMR